MPTPPPPQGVGSEKLVNPFYRPKRKAAPKPAVNRAAKAKPRRG